VGALAGPSPIFMPYVARNDLPGFLARHVIVLIGDGMGLEQVKAGGMYLNGQPGTLPFEAFPYQAQVTTYSYGGEVTDSAAASTAMATGHKVENKVISEEIPGGGRELYTLLEYARDRDMSTGLVTTTPITDATPGSFGAHTADRGNIDEIASDYLNASRPNILFGGSGALTTSLAQQAGYTIVTDRAALQSLTPDSQAHISGQFAETYLPYELDGLGNAPHLSEMTSAALRVLGGDPDGFFLVVEGGRIDTAAHQNDGPRMVGEVAEFARAAQVVIDWQASHPDTIILVLADHETGGLQVTANNGTGKTPDMAWTTTGHTGVNIGLWMSGLSPAGLPAVLDNTQVPWLLTGGRFQP
jgi:alkaline phosphatase